MLKAGSILYALFIVIIVAIITTSIIFISYSNNLYTQIFYITEQLYYETYSAIILNISNNEPQPQSNSDAIHTVTNKFQWGAFQLTTSTSKWKDKSISRSALSGTLPLKKEGLPLALIITNNRRSPLYLVGNASIQGYCELPQKGLERGIAEGKNYTGKYPLLKGIKKISGNEVPKINSELINKINLSYYNFFSLSDSINDIDRVGIPDSLIRSFSNTPQIYTTTDKLIINNSVIKGNVILRSDKSIYISANSVLNDVLIMAPKIYIEDGFEGSVHMVATDSVTIGKQVKLNYPSSIVVIGKKGNNHCITLNEEAILDGVVIISSEEDKKYASLITIEKNALVKGQVYCTGKVQLKGSVYGSVICHSFILHTPFTTYDNYLLDAEINPVKLSAHFIGVSIVENEMKNNKIVKWLY